MIKKIDNIDIPELEIYKKLRDNIFDKENSFIADSPKVVNLLLNSDLEVKSILATKEYYDEFQELIEFKNIAKLYLTTKSEMQKIVGHKIHHNVMMHGVRPSMIPLDSLGDGIIMLDEMSYSENIGSIARSAVALGVDSYLLSHKTPHPYGRRALRVSMGHTSMLKVHIYDEITLTIQSLKKMGYKIFAAEVTNASIPLAEVKVPEKWVLLMGHESKGIAKEILDICDEVVTIEMQEGIKSFNVAIAASIMMYQFKNTNK